MIKTVFLLPVRDNEDRPFDGDAWAELDRRLLRFGGASAGGLVSGAWEGRHGIRREQSREYHVGLTGWTDLPDWLDLVRWVRRRFRQEAVYIEVAGIPEILQGD